MTGPRQFVFLSTHDGFGRWDWTTARDRGIGGSETSHIELARRLARRGHRVISYAPVPFTEARRDDAGVLWSPFETADYRLPGTWLVYRSPELIGRFSAETHASQRVYLICQDVWYPSMDHDRGARFDAVVALCTTHAQHLAARYKLDNIGISSNGICASEMRNLPAERRHVNRLIWTSSPDRGLLPCLRIFRRVREWVPSAELHIFYGYDNIDLAIAEWVRHNPGGDLDQFPTVREKNQVMKEADQPGVVWRGRVGQRELWREYLRASFWVYPTDFSETSCISSMEAMALGAIPVTRPYWPLAENVQHGVLIDGDPVADPLVRSRYVKAVVDLMGDPALCEKIRADMTGWALDYFDWEVVASQCEEWAEWQAGNAEAFPGPTSVAVGEEFRA